MTQKRALFWFRHDLRVEDNQALTEICKRADSLICLFIVDPRWFKPAHYQSAHMGQHRWRFLRQSLADLQGQLRRFGQRLLVIEGQPLDVINNIIERSDISLVGANRHPGVYERQQWQRLKEKHRDVIFTQTGDHCLFDAELLPFSIEQLPNTFTPFRKTVEDIDAPLPLSAPADMPPPFSLASNYPLFNVQCEETLGTGSVGGSHAGRSQLRYFLEESHHVRRYKQTRNDLDGWDYSSKLSGWLANGSLSARQVYAALKRYEKSFGENESTYWLYFELLWREFFQWHMYQHDSKLFHFTGVKSKRPLTTFHPQRFARWCMGQTPFPIVNACMHQLNETGFMSNRGRQIVASCLVNELGVDWRYGAAYFEQQLIDFDVAANWGNWQYLAGVGADPRGNRHFDLQKQTRMFDPDCTFINAWKGKTGMYPLDTTDAADWPCD